jgi:gluconokinase
MIVIVMGVASAGKTGVADELALQTGWPQIEGDDLHPPANREKMTAGTPLTDADRWPWLDAIGAELNRHMVAGQPLIVTCSALKRHYRDRLRGFSHGLHFLHLHGPRDLLEERMSGRKGHFMPPALLPSQLATLEMPGEDEPDVFQGDIALSIPVIVSRFLEETQP